MFTWTCHPTTRSPLDAHADRRDRGGEVASVPTDATAIGADPIAIRDRLILKLKRVCPSTISTHLAGAAWASAHEAAMDIQEECSLEQDLEAMSIEEEIEDSLEEVRHQAPVGREHQYSMLMNVFGKLQGTDDPRFNIPCGLLLWGAPSSGKSHVVAEVLKAAHVERSAQVSAFDLMEGTRVFLNEILRQLIGLQEGLKKNVENGMQFLEALVELQLQAEDRVVIVVHNAELLRVDHEDILYVLLAAQEETGLKICTILCSKVPPVGYFSTMFMKQVPTVHFPLYSKDELSKIIHQEFAELHEKKFFNDYLNAFINVQTKNCRDVRKLIRMFELSYNIFLRNPQVKTAKNFRELWSITKTNVGASFSSSSTSTNPVASTSAAARYAPVPTDNVVTKNLPLHAKYVLVAAYLASQNPASSDKRFFVLSRASSGKKPNIITTGVKKESETGAAVVQSRLIAIIAALMKQSCRTWEMTTSFLSTIPTLCAAGFIEAVGNPLDECKYRSCTDYDLVVKLGQEIGIDVTKYLLRMI